MWPAVPIANTFFCMLIVFFDLDVGLKRCLWNQIIELFFNSSFNQRSADIFEMFSDIEGIVKLSLIHLVTGPLAEPMIGSVCAEMLKVMYYTTFLKYHYSRCFT